ncbi:hypothetical protein [Streptomyces sp. NPDC047315]
MSSPRPRGCSAGVRDPRYADLLLIARALDVPLAVLVADDEP